MDLWQLLQDLLFDYTLRTVALGAGTLGIVSGALGTYAVLRKQSLLGDAMSHAALPGIALAFLLTGSKAPLVLMIGATIAGWAGTLFLMSIINTTRVKDDSALGLVLSVFFGFGLMLLTFVQRRPDATQAGLDKFLFGQAAALLERDVITMAAVGAVALLTMVVFWKEFKLLSFDPEFGASLGFPMRLLDVVLTTLLVIAIVIGLQAVGVVLMSAMIVAPAAAARQWTDRLSVMVGLAALFGALSGVGGAVVSSTTTGLSTGPTIVLCASFIVIVSFALASNRGLVWEWVRHQRNRRQLRVDAILTDLYTLASQHGDPDHGHTIEVLRAMSGGQGGVERSLRELETRGWVRLTGDEWSLTPEGLAEAERLGGSQ
ncbi:MAG: metal ABC transporter permease [Chloroflexi bacterium]|nr:metal ABC transporter permease [Chloroflexota bacterium]